MNATALPAVSLERVGESLVEARDVINSTDDSVAIQNVLISLCRASYDALLAWELDTATPTTTPTDPETWRTPLDELRVQAALAEMELRDTAIPGIDTVDHLIRVVSTRIAAARDEVGRALTDLRAEMRKAMA